MSGGGSDEVLHPQGVTESDLAYRQAVKEKIVTGEAATRFSHVTVFANTMQELQVRFTTVSPTALRWACGCKVDYEAGGKAATIAVCEGHR